ncbi:hypothetical protein G7Z17_g1063 [Cylindrodendrum hubeiense]|uniref:Gag protein n=1 Tax=Cylindrodendrum hubeiense TaxID=595255 RepID=A0A9P5HLM3_9HYPO|nr:hypothetical protein G7Z17_g1063 [Cylindrodendrum hubeiense]
MSAKNAASEQKVYLRTFQDWADWDRTFKTKAISGNIWKVINPKGSDQPMEEPAVPTFSSYFQRIPPQRIEPDRPYQTRQSESQSSSQTLPPTYTAETTDPTQPASSIKDLTAEDKAAYQSDRKDYDQDYRRYEEQHRVIVKMRDWVLETVAKSLADSSCDPEQDLRTWYTNLQARVGATTSEQQSDIWTKYQKVLMSAPKGIKEYPRWITNWEQALHKAQDKEVGGLDNPVIWFDNLCKTIQPVLGNWVSNYRSIYWKELKEKSLSIRETAQDLRAEVNQLALQQPVKQTTTRAIRGAFGPTFGIDPDSAVQPDPDPEDPQLPGPSGPSGSPETAGTNRGPKKRKSG